MSPESTNTPGPMVTIEQINALPEAGGWWPMGGLNDRIVRLLKAAVSLQHAKSAESFTRGLQITQRDRDQIREERDAVMDAEARLRNALEQIAYGQMTADEARSFARAAIAKATA